MASGNRSDEKKRPEKIHIGSMTRFINPLTVSVVPVRLAISRPIPAKARAPTISSTATSNRLPWIGIPKTNTPRDSSTATSGIRKVSRANKIAIRKSRRGIGWPMNRFRSLPIRKVDEQETDAPEPPPIVFWPIRPGIRKSM